MHARRVLEPDRDPGARSLRVRAREGRETVALVAGAVALVASLGCVACMDSPSGSRQLQDSRPGDAQPANDRGVGGRTDSGADRDAPAPDAEDTGAGEPDADAAGFDGADSDVIGPDATEAPDVGTHADTGTRAPRIWCGTKWPTHTRAAAGFPTERLYARVWVDAETPSGGSAQTFQVAFGAGPAADPPGAPSWVWADAEHNAFCSDCGNDDEWMSELVPSTPGEYAWGARVRHLSGAEVFCDRFDEGRAGSNDGFAGGSAATLSVAPPGAVAVATINLRCLLDDWDSRLPILANGLAESGAEIIGIQEACAEAGGRDNLVELVSSLEARTGHQFSVTRAITHRSWDRYDEGIAVLSSSPVREIVIADLPTGTFPRKVIGARVVSAQGPVVFGATHLDLESSVTRGRQLASAIRTLARVSRASEAIVLAGDFNEGPGGEVTNTLESEGFDDLWGTLRAGDPGPTFPASAPLSRIDYITFRASGSGFDPIAIDRTFSTPLGTTYASDHLGLAATLWR